MTYEIYFESDCIEKEHPARYMLQIFITVTASLTLKNFCWRPSCLMPRWQGSDHFLHDTGTCSRSRRLELLLSCLTVHSPTLHLQAHCVLISILNLWRLSLPLCFKVNQLKKNITIPKSNTGNVSIVLPFFKRRRALPSCGQLWVVHFCRCLPTTFLFSVFWSATNIDP